jgi:hypothetical protein
MPELGLNALNTMSENLIMLINIRGMSHCIEDVINARDLRAYFSI